MAGSLSRILAWWVLLLICLLSVAASLIVLALALGATLDPTSSYYATISSSLWTTFGPHFVVVAIVSSLAAVACLLGGPIWLGRAATLLSAAAILASGFIVGSIMAATSAAGGSVDPLAGLILGKMGEPPPDQVVSVTAGNESKLTTAIYLPPTPAADAPVLVYIHGGGFMIGTNTETAADLRWFADRGWVVFSLDYRLFTAGNPTWDQAPVDVACGLAWVYANAEAYGGDPDRLALLGDSAGGNLAVNLA